MVKPQSICVVYCNTDPSPQQVAGESGLGKTTFINTLFSTTIKNYQDHKRRHAKQVDKTVEIEITKAELEEKFFKGKNQQDGIIDHGLHVQSASP